jgi:uncharacterized membrane protein (DUF485 family)
VVAETDCSCFTLQAAGSTPVVMVNPVVTIGLISALLIIVAALIMAIYVRRPSPYRGRRLWW